MGYNCMNAKNYWRLAEIALIYGDTDGYEDNEEQ